MEEDIEKYKKDCDLLELTDDELISEAKATIIDAMNRKSDGFRRPEKVALVAIENLIARNKDLEEDLHDNKEYIRELHHKLTNAIEIKYIHKDYIPKSKVREKIEEYEELVKDFEEYWSKDPRQFKKEKCVDYYKIEALKELLQEGDK